MESNSQVQTEKSRVPVDSASDTGPDMAQEAAQGKPILISEDQHTSAPKGVLMGSSDARAQAVTLSEDARGIIEQLKSNQGQGDRCLLGMQAALQESLGNITKLMVKLHNHLARVSVLFHLWELLLVSRQGV